MAEEYSWSWETPDYGFGTPQEEAPAFDFGADVDWGLTDTSNWGMLDDSWDMFQPLEEDIDWANFDFEEEYGIPSLYDDPYTQYGDYSFNMDAPSYDWGNVMDENWQPDWQNQFSTPSLRDYLGEEVEYGYDPYSIGSGIDQYYGDEYGDAWRSPWAQGDDPLAGFNFDAEGNITAPEFSWFPSGEESGIETLINTGGVGPTGPAPAAGGNRPVLNALAGIFGLGPAGPNAAGVTGRRRPQSPFAGGMSVTPEWMKRIGDKIGLGGRSGLQDAYVTGYPEGTGQGIFGGGGLGSLFGGDGDGGMGGLMMPLGLGILAAQAAKDDRGVDLTPSVTMDPLGRYTLSGTGPEERKEFGLGEIPTSLDFSAYEDIMGGS